MEYVISICADSGGALVARIVSDVLTRQKDSTKFRISILTCSITYM